MGAKYFTTKEWKTIRDALEEGQERFGLPKREYGSVLLGCFNIRRLGSSRYRNQHTWEFLAYVCSHFDLLAIQEIMDDLSGLRRLMDLLGPDFGFIASDVTGAFPDSRIIGERLGFIFNRRVVQRTEIATDISYDRSDILDTLTRHRELIWKELENYGQALTKAEIWKAGGKVGRKPKKPKIKLPTFLSFVRQPFCVSMRIAGHPGAEPYEFMAINAHLFFGDYMSDRRQEFDALIEWIMARIKQNDRAYYPNFILLGDLNLDFDHPETDRRRIEKYMKTFNNAAGEEASVNFPFLDIHPDEKAVFRTNARLSETFDQIGLFTRDKRFPSYRDNDKMGQNPKGPDYGVFNFVNLFSEVLKGKPFHSLSPSAQKNFLASFEYKVSDHMPLWLRLPLP